MSGINAEGAGVPVADGAEVAGMDEAGQDAGAAGAVDGGEVSLNNDGDDEGVPVADDPDADAEDDADDDADDAGKPHKLTPEQQAAVNKRIAALTAKRKAAETERDALKKERDELAERAARLGDPAAVRAAEAAGVLPELVGKGDAERIARYQESERSAEVFGDWLEDHADAEDTLAIAGQSYTREQVREFKRAHQRRLKELSDVPAVISKLRGDTAEVLRLGMAARKAGWKPGGAAAGAAAAAGPAAAKKLPSAPAPARTMPGGAAKPRPAAQGATKKAYAGGIRDEDDLARAIESGELG